MDEQTCIAFLLNALCFTSEISGTIQYANIGESVKLICQHTKGAEDLRWLKNNAILADGLEINEGIPRHTMFAINAKTAASQYNLMISNVTADDFGAYLCEMQIRKQVSRIPVILTDKEFLTSTTTNPASHVFQKRITDTLFPSEISNTRSILTTLSENTVPTNGQKYSYGLFAAGFVVVLLVSIGCNICINNYKNRVIQSQVKQHTIEIQSINIADESIQEFGSVDEISNVSSKYLTINENDMAVLDNTSHESQLQAQTFSRNLSLPFDQAYLEVIGDDVDFIEETLESPSRAMIQMEMLKSGEPYTDDVDAELNSYRSVNNSKHFEESNISSTSKSPIHVDMESVNKLIDRKNFSTGKTDFKNLYLTLNTKEMNNCQSCYTTVKSDMKSKIIAEKLYFKAIKRHSFP